MWPWQKIKIADDDGSRDLDLPEFKKAVHGFRIGLNEKDSERLFRIFERDGMAESTTMSFLEKSAVK
jgi:hypothetical protein